MSEVLLIGETMAVFVPKDSGPLRYVQDYKLKYAGAESNTAVGLCKMGHSSEWMSRLGDDELGQYIIAQIRAEGVSTEHVIMDPDHPTGLMIKEFRQPEETFVHYYRAGSAASHLTPDDLDESMFLNAHMLHITGITPVLSENCLNTVMKAIELAEQHHLLICFDPNIRLKLWRDRDCSGLIKNIMDRCHIIILGIEEGRTLFGTDSPEDLFSLLFRNPSLRYAALKQGSNGAYVSSGNETHFIPPYPCSPVDPVGAGDAFNAGFLSGILEKRTLLECGRIAGIAGALCTQNAGDIEGIPTRSEIQQHLDHTCSISR